MLEVETPLLCQHSVTDPFIDSLAVQQRWLQTSPEYAMKRLLAANSGDIFQICKAFRQDEAGKQHNPEFTMLEWYRLGFDHHELMNDVERLISSLLDVGSIQRQSYRACWQQFTQIDPLQTSCLELSQFASRNALSFAKDHAPKELDDWLQAIMSLYIEPKLSMLGPCFIYDFPASQSALATLDPADKRLAQRFELYINGIELANGFHELTDADQQRSRFEKNNLRRQQLGKHNMTIDERLIAALQHGLPACAGVAVGIDRLLMLMTQNASIKQVLCYDWQNA